MIVNDTFTTSGTGFWSDSSVPVFVTHMDLGYVDKEEHFGELRVYFNSSWNVSRDGLIYTDPNWIRDFRQWMVENLFSTIAANQVSYSEQGMQGDDYVSLDVREIFLAEFKKLNQK